MKKISEFLSENFHFLMVNFSVYLNGLVFVMPNAINEDVQDRSQSRSTAFRRHDRRRDEEPEKSKH